MQNASVLIVEDEIIIAYDLQHKLQMLGYRVPDICTSGEEALKTIETSPPDLILMDIRLQGRLTGIDTAEQILKLYNIPVIYLTAHTDNNTLEKAKHTRPYGYLIKPLEDERSLYGPIEIALYKHQMEIILKERESWFSSTLQSIQDAVITVDKLGQITVINPKAHQLTGYHETPDPDTEIDPIVHLSVQNEPILISQWLLDTLNTGERKPLPDQTRLISGDNHVCDVEGMFSPIVSPKGEITGAVFSFHDISERIKSDARIRESETKFRQIVEASPMGMHMYRLDDNDQLIFIGANPAADSILAILHHQFIGKTIEAAFPHLTDTEVPERFRGICKTGEPWHTEQLIHKSDTVRDVFEIYGFQTAPGMMTSMFLDITERKRIEDRLQRTQFSLDHVGEGAFWIKKDAGIAEVNHTACKMLGYKREDLLQMTIIGIDANLSRSAWDTFWETIEKSKYDVSETSFRTRSGREFPVEIISNFLAYDGNEYDFMVIRDITERQKHIRELQESQRRLSLFVRNFRGIAYQVQLKEKKKYIISHIEGDLERITGYPSELFHSGKIHWNELIHPDDMKKVLAEDSRILANPGYMASIEYRIIRKDGSIGWVKDIARIIETEEIPLYQGSIFDITERIHAELALRESEEKYRSLVELANDGILILQKGIIRFANNRVFEMLNLSATKVLNEPWLNFVYPEDRSLVLEYYNRRIKGENVAKTFEVRIRLPHHRNIPVEISTDRISYNEQDAILVYMRDIQERKKTEAAMQQAQSTYHLASLGTLAAGISHEINQPLTALKVKVDGLLYWGEENPDFLQKNLKKNLQFLSDQADEIDKIIRHMRSLIYQEKAPSTAIDINQIIQKACRFIQQQLASHGINLEMKLSPKKPQVYAIGTPLEQVILNLITNAMHALDRVDKEDKAVEIQTSVKQNDCLITIRDNGPGIPEDHINRIFDPLFTTEKGGKGMGLGLAIVQELLRQFKGTIRVKNRAGGGAQFTVQIPLLK